ncbi:MAG: ABC transporter ATP-binding protein [Spirochaetales bacterium]|nr:ABC transporter ATP-binding protein [Spirochaetales bacterium]
MIEVENLDFTYKKGKKNAVDKIDFCIDKGEIFGFLGPSGAGKTTTQRILIGLLKGYHGSVRIMGKERSSWNRDFYDNVGVAFDFPNLYQKLTALENLKLIQSYYSGESQNIEELLDRVGLLADKDKKTESYSKGMKMRLNFVRAIMHDPEILFFDEPTSGLDPVNAKIIKDIIVELKNRGKTIFLTTHNMTVADQLCDRVGFIVDGRLEVVDRPRELKVQYGEPTVKLEYYEADSSRTMEFRLEDISQNEDFFNTVKTKIIKTIHSQEATLEDIFIKLTGRELL